MVVLVVAAAAGVVAVVVEKIKAATKLLRNRHPHFVIS